jgi:hypothetical protein
MARIIPLIHMNGNSKAALAAQYENADSALYDAVEKFNAIEFHPRDYYPLGDGSWDQATMERAEVQAAFRLIQDYIQEIRMGIYEQK